VKRAKFQWLGAPAGKLVRSNFYKEVAKEWRESLFVCANCCNVITGTQLAGQQGGKAVALPLGRNDRRIAWHEVGSPVRIVAVLRATMKAQVPVGYEDETGFHYGADNMDLPFSV